MRDSSEQTNKHKLRKHKKQIKVFPTDSKKFTYNLLETLSLVLRHDALIHYEMIMMMIFEKQIREGKISTQREFIYEGKRKKQQT